MWGELRDLGFKIVGSIELLGYDSRGSRRRELSFSFVS